MLILPLTLHSASLSITERLVTSLTEFFVEEDAEEEKTRSNTGLLEKLLPWRRRMECVQVEGDPFS